MKKLFFLLTLTFWTLFCFDVLADSWVGWSFSCSWNNCLKAGVDAAGRYIGNQSGVITGKGIVDAVQDVIVYFLSFMSIVAVIYIMWAGAQMLLFPSNEESSEKTKKIILSVILGIVIIWFAYWIVSTIFYLLNNNKVVANIVPRAYAETQIRSIDFTTYTNKIRAISSRLSGGYSPEVTKELSILIDGAYDHLPDRADIYENRAYYERVKKAIADYDLHREDIDRGIVENALSDFLERTKTFIIQGQIVANPRQGDAPLSVTLQATNIQDTSGTVIPETNFTWWLRTAEGAKILGRGKTINYEFRDEGTYTVYLTVNSASKNSRGFNDVISFEDQIIVEIGQPKLKYIIYFNEQLAADSIKIPTKESLQKVLIDATQTKFAYGYTVAKTEWDFWNGKGMTRDGPPVIEAQDYREGDYTVKLTLTRNDGETFSKQIALKVGDPIASIGVSNKRPNKGETVVFEAKKATQDGVLYSWEIRKFGIEQPIFTATGARMEYAFRDIGRYGVSLLSTKDQIRDKETVEIAIESRPPVVRFSAEMLGSETPNIFVFDGTSTYDPDYPDNQKIKYEWFVNDKSVQLRDTNSNNSRGVYTFSEIGAHQVELHVTDDEGKTASFKKTITIKSLLSIQLGIRPQVVKRGEKVVLSANATNGDIYEWSIGSKQSTTTESGRHVVTFEKSGTYPVTLKVTDRSGNTNSIQRKIYVVDGDAPFAVITLSTKSFLTETQKWACNGEDALVVDRVTPVSLVGDKSINVGGTTTDLTYFWKIGVNASSSQKNLNHTFDELGCEKISLTVNDKKTGASHTSEEWVKAVNIPPKFSDIQVNVENIDQDPLRVNLRMEGAKDPDGNIISYTWYYYTSTDEQPQGFRITTKPETSFLLPKINGRYYFSVVLEDANGLKVDTRDISESKFSTPDLLVNQNISMPIIDFRVNTPETRFGDPVEFSVNVRNALGQDISKVCEYRWDVDGDGFYDIKTSEPRYNYKYTFPKEYHPKVKVTHRWLSTTKFVTVNVINRLNPQAVVQVIGDKIVAYNTSTGVVQSVNWFADGKKISENKEYLVYNVSEGTFPTTLKLQISDGKDTQEASFEVARNAKNKTLLKKIERPLVVLSNLSREIEALPDDVTWRDPLSPLFLYLGESSGDIQYYLIDNDITIDTDLSGGKDDDADNKWTASYRMGRPYAIPIGNKRVTIMRIRIVKNDGTEIDSRQIRVTREFIAPIIDENPAVVTIKDPTTVFNLTGEDKARLDKLQMLVKNTAQEDQKELQRYIDQLWDIWYDRADRAETLLQLSNAVSSSTTISAELKTRILDQIALIYTQGEQDAQEKTLARKMITDFISKSTYRKEILGDGTEENPGLLGQIIDNPEYYEQNTALVKKIYEEYIKFDTQLSEEAKALIREKLTLLAGKPPVDNKPAPVVEETSTNGWLDALKKKLPGGNIGMIALWIVVGLVGLFGLIFILRKLLGGNDEHEAKPAPTREDHGLSTIPDNGHSGPDWMHNQDDHALPWISEDHGTSSPDWLKESENSFGEEDVLSKEIATDILTDNNKNNSDHTERPETVTEPIVVPSSTPSTWSSTQTEHEVPDWLSGAEKASTPETHNTEIVVPVEKGAPAETPLQTTSSEWDHEVPDWLRGSETPTLNTELEKTGIIQEPPEKNLTESDTVISKEATTAQENPPTALADEQLPEWLRGSETWTQTETTEANTPASTLLETEKNTITPDSSENKPISAWDNKKKENNQAMKSSSWAKKTGKKWDDKKHWKKWKWGKKETAQGMIGPAVDLLKWPDHLLPGTEDVLITPPDKKA